MDQCRLTKEDKGNDELTLGKNSIDLLGLTKEDKDGDDFLCRVSNIVQERQENYNIFWDLCTLFSWMQWCPTHQFLKTNIEPKHQIHHHKLNIILLSLKHHLIVGATFSYGNWDQQWALLSLHQKHTWSSQKVSSKKIISVFSKKGLLLGGTAGKSPAVKSEPTGSASTPQATVAYRKRNSSAISPSTHVACGWANRPTSSASANVGLGQSNSSATSPSINVVSCFFSKHKCCM